MLIEPQGLAAAARSRRGVTPRHWALALLVGFVTVAAVQPAPDARPPTQPAWLDAVTVATLALLLVAFVALLADRRWGFGVATYGSAGFVVVSALCPVWQHHQVGSWWVGQSAVSIAMFVGSLILRSRAMRPAAHGPTARLAARTFARPTNSAAGAGTANTR